MLLTLGTQVRVMIVTRAHLRMCMFQDNGVNYSIEGFNLIELIPRSGFLSIVYIPCDL